MKNLATISILASISCSMFVIESAIPLPILPPGAKIGLSNLVIVTTLYALDARIALSVLITRIALTSMIFGGGAIFFYSATAGISSFIIMILLKRVGIFTIMGISSTGGFTHNLTQIIVARILMESDGIWNYLPILGIIGIWTGFIIGKISAEIVKRVKTYQI